MSCRENLYHGRQYPLRGFTLLELLLVLLLIGIAYGVVGPMLGNRPTGLEQQNAVRMISAGLRKTRDQAVYQGTETILTLDTERKTFAISGDSRVYPLPKILNYSIYTAASEVLQDTVASFRFYPDGSSTGGRVSAIAPGGAALHVDIDWLTGRTRVY